MRPINLTDNRVRTMEKIQKQDAKQCAKHKHGEQNFFHHLRSLARIEQDMGAFVAASQAAGGRV